MVIPWRTLPFFQEAGAVATAASCPVLVLLDLVFQTGLEAASLPRTPAWKRVMWLCYKSTAGKSRGFGAAEVVPVRAREAETAGRAVPLLLGAGVRFWRGRASPSARSGGGRVPRVTGDSRAVRLASGRAHHGQAGQGRASAPGPSGRAGRAIPMPKGGGWGERAVLLPPPSQVREESGHVPMAARWKEPRVCSARLGEPGWSKPNAHACPVLPTPRRCRWTRPARCTRVGGADRTTAGCGGGARGAERCQSAAGGPYHGPAAGEGGSGLCAGSRLAARALSRLSARPGRSGSS